MIACYDLKIIWFLLGSVITVAEVLDFFLYNSLSKVVKKKEGEDKRNENQTMQNGHTNGTNAHEGHSNKAFSTRV